MNNFLKTSFITTLALTAITTQSKADIVLNFTGGVLFGANTSSPLANGRLVYAVTSTNNVFGGPVAGSFTSGNSVLLGSWSVNSNVGAPGAFDASLSGITIGNGINAGQQIAIFWFESLNLGSSAPTGGEKYGFYTDPSWIVPSDGSNTTISLETQAIGGSVSNNLTVANLTVTSAIPEPSTFTILAGLASLCFVSLRRKR